MRITDEFISALRGGQVLVVGDCMLDAYLMGDAERISPEAPVPVVRITEECHYLGGAGNVARNVAALGGKATLIGGVGRDSSARILSDLLHAEGVIPGFAELTRPTTVKTRVMARRQQMLRLDREESSPYTAEETAAVLKLVEQHLPGHPVVILSDYAKGLFTPAFMDAFRPLAAQHGVKVLVDPKPANIHLYSGVTLLTPNARETLECAALPLGRDGLLKTTHTAILASGREILRRTGSAHLLSTLGPDGMAVFESADEIWHIPTVARDVFDVTGAGDTVIATLALSLAVGHALLPSCLLANYAAGIVVGRVGASTASPDELLYEVGRNPVAPQRLC